MKKYLIIFITCLSISTLTVYALNLNFHFDADNLSFSKNSKLKNIESTFSSIYNLTYSIESENSEIENEIIELTKKTTYLLLGDFNNKNESNEEYYKRHQEYYELAAYNYFSKDKNTDSGYDETNPLYTWASMSEFAIPQMFNVLNELEILYNSYGDIRVTIDGDLVISALTLSNVKMKEEDPNDSMNYIIKKTNLTIYYYFIKIGNEYKLSYLYGEINDDLNQYFNEIENSETKNSMAITTSYESDLFKTYNFDKLNSLSEEQINNIYEENLQNVVFLKSYYNNKIISNANGIFINNGIILTTWSFLENALVDSQYITVTDNLGKNYEIDGIITVNTNTDIALIKLKNKTDTNVKLSEKDNINVENPVIVLSSKSGVGLSIQKGIVISNSKYLQTSIPLSKSDEGSPVFDENGLLIGLNTSKSIESNISIAINIDAIKEIQSKFNNIDFDTIETISFDKLKEEFYYTKYSSEEIVNNISNNKWKTYKTIGNIEDTIKLELVKASYKNGIVSLRYKNNISNYISSMQFSSAFKEQLENDGYEIVTDSSTKVIYKNDKYKVIIMEEFDYLIVVMVKL